MYKMSTFIVVSHGMKFDFDTTNWLEAVLMAHAQQGIKIRLDRSSASLTKKDGSTDQDRLDCAIKMAKSIQSGEMPKSGGGGSRLSIEDKALKTALQTTFTFDKKESLTDALTRFTKGVAEDQNVVFEPYMVGDVIAELEKSDTYKNVIESDKAKTRTSSMMAGITLGKKT